MRGCTRRARDDGRVSTSNDFLAELAARGLIHDTTDRSALADRLNAGPLTLYHGCDPTADSLHVGHLIGLLVLRRFADAGHRPVALAGGATGMIGDPSGRSSERNLLDAETLAGNVAAIKSQIQRIVPNVELVDNLDWTAPTTLIDFLRDVGKHVTVNQMIARESVKTRMASENGISFTEFSYMLLQANDYLHLHRDRACELQVGGSDQWGNILSGVDLVRRVTGAAVHALCWPLLTAPDGTKLGKSTGARIWLDPKRTTPYQFFQYWMATDDRQLGEFLAKFTLLDLEEIASVVADHESGPAARRGQRRLAEEATRLVHGPESTRLAAEAARLLFGGSVLEASAQAFATLADEVPTWRPDASDLSAGIPAVDALAASGLCASKKDARRTLDQGGAYLNDERIDAEARVNVSHLLHGRYALLRRGRKAYALVLVGAAADLDTPEQVV